MLKPRNPWVVIGRQRKANVIKDKRLEADLSEEFDDCCEICLHYRVKRKRCLLDNKLHAPNFVCSDFEYYEWHFLDKELCYYD